MQIPGSVERSRYHFAKSLFSSTFPNEPFVSQSAEAWCGEFDLPDEIEQYYLSLGPNNVTIDNYGNPFFLPSLSELWEFQAGYRYHPSSGVKFEDWSDDWLVIADQEGDPFIFSRSSGKILYALHGQGLWQAEELFADLEAMVTTIAILGTVTVDAGENFTDDDCNLQPRFVNEAKQRIADILGVNHSAETILNALGWL